MGRRWLVVRRERRRKGTALGCGEEGCAADEDPGVDGERRMAVQWMSAMNWRSTGWPVEGGAAAGSVEEGRSGVFKGGGGCEP